MSTKKIKPEQLRSRQWFNNPDDAEMTALYTERYLNYGLTREELRDGRPIIAIAQTGSDLSPCNRHHLELAKRVRDGIISAGGLPIEVPVQRPATRCQKWGVLLVQKDMPLGPLRCKDMHAAASVPAR